MSGIRVPAVRVTVPASTANLGSGFDALGMALALYNVVHVRVTDSGLVVRTTGEGTGEVPEGENNLVVRAIRAACAHLDIDPPGLELTCHNSIPHARGLGSSASAAVAGVAAAYGLAGRQLDGEALRVAAGFEGHADNAAPSLYGGLTLVWAEEAGFRALRLEPHAGLRPVVLVPAQASATAQTRGLLPEKVPHADAAFSAARAALAVQAVTEHPELLLPATEDRLHQDYRERAWPSTMRVVRALRERGVAAMVSGAGPTVMVLTLDGILPEEVDLNGFQVHQLAVDRRGVVTEATPMPEPGGRRGRPAGEQSLA